MRRLPGLILGLAIGGAAHAQTAPSPADVGILHGNPDIFKLLDSSKTWVPFGSIDPSSHVFTPVGGGGGGGGDGPLTIYSTHSALLGLVTTPIGPWTVQQQGFYAPGDGGAATYNWNATSVCPPDVSGTTQPADGIICILSSGQSAITPGRYILQMGKGGVLNALQAGFSADGRDNAPMNFTLSTIMSHYMGMTVNFPANPLYGQSNYWFSQPLEIVNTGSVTCNDGTRVYVYPAVNLVFGPGVSGVRFEGYPTNYYLAANYTGIGSYTSNLDGCGIFSVGMGGFHSASTTAGNPVMNNVGFPSSDQYNRGVKNAPPLLSVGDGIAVFHTIDYWNFSGSITGDILTVTSWGGASFGSPDPGIAPEQLLRDAGVAGANVPVGTWIQQTHAQDPTLTGTGHTGTYRISPSIASPIAGAAQAKPGTITGNFVTEIQSGGPVVATGTTVVGCSTLSGTHCGAGGTITLSNAPTLTLAAGVWMLPGPNTSYPYGSQMYNVTTSRTGQTYGPFTAGVSDGAGGSGNILTVTGASTTSIAPGQSVILSTVKTTTTTAALTIGENASIPVASCTGIVGGMFVVGTSGGNPVFPPGATVAGCSGTSLSVNLDQGPIGAGTTSGSNLVYLNANQVSGYQLWIGEPITGTGIPANTIVASTAKMTPYSNGTPTITISNNATATTGPIGRGSPSLSFGGAMFAAPSGTTLTFLGGSIPITDYGTGTGGNGTYILGGSTFIAPGTAYTFDTPWTMYVRGGPRPMHQQDLLWSDAFPFGSVADQIYGKTAANQTVMVGQTSSYGNVSAMATHTAGSGSAWVLPSGIGVNVAHNTYGNLVNGFPIGINMACGGLNSPTTGCGRSYDSNNFFVYGLVGRLTAGNNGGGSTSLANEYDYNHVADIVEFATVGSTYTGEMLQGEDESTNTHDLIMVCSNNGSSFTGIYASGAGWAGTCVAENHGMLGTQPGYRWSVPWFGQIYGAQADSLLVSGQPQVQIPSVDCSAGTPSSSFTVVAGHVTHC